MTTQRDDPTLDGDQRRRPGSVTVVTAPSDPFDRRAARSRLLPYLVRAWLFDVLMVTLGIGVGVLADRTVLSETSFGMGGGLTPAGSLALIWLASMLVVSAYDQRVVGTGPEEYKRVAGATVLALGIFSTISYFAKADSARRFLVVALLAVLGLALLGRFVLRGWLGRARARGRFLNRTVIVGQGRHAVLLADRLRQAAYAGFEVVGQITPPRNDESVEHWLDSVQGRLDALSVDAVAVAEMSGIDSDLVRRLSWRLEGPRIDLLVSPALSDFAGPRLSVRPASGVPLIHLDEPQLNGPKATVKRTVDMLGSMAILLLISPLLLAVGALIKLTSRGPVLFTQQRVGRNGEPFSFLKFRTMVVGAHDMRGDVIGEPDDEISERYRTDPRITRVGRVLRRWSIDEFPQLVHVLTGRMSLVGPRPLLVDELPLLVDSDHRRHMTKPGLTGLWQVSGRKDVEWEERMRLDLWYVENWSPALDLVILARTVRAVVSGRGAY